LLKKNKNIGIFKATYGDGDDFTSSEIYLSRYYTLNHYIGNMKTPIVTIFDGMSSKRK
jgi:hypothetical protein